ncbi:trypsin-like serine protease [Streptomyces sp. YIM 98790]|uniref:trypsin-like serine protease n=1 Tax=Streptomyces sp. YIM 98790 TaxID=2689077 RepID=UPI0028BDD0EA|nr:trypsin-like serine protease [Streptomyces sp. YIM 98790]
MQATSRTPAAARRDSRRTVLRRTAVTAAAAGALTLAGALPAGAINSYNAEPAPERTEVGALVVQWDNDADPSTPDRVRWVCSGTMIDRDTFLTAAHCTTGWPEGTRFHVSLEEDVQGALDAAAAAHPGDADAVAAAVAVEGEAHSHPGYPGTSADSKDIAVVELPADEPAGRWTFTPATLPAAGQLGDAGPQALNAADWVVAGYGTQEGQTGAHGHPGGGVRLKAPLTFNALNKTWVRLSMIEANGNGGACYGDSGGPNFVLLGGERLLAGTTITGDVPCYATNVAYRLDTPVARAFLAPFTDLP